MAGAQQSEIVAARASREASTCAIGRRDTLGIALDETHDAGRRRSGLARVRRQTCADRRRRGATRAIALPAALQRTSAFLTHPVFHTHHSETEMLRYMRRLADRDLALDRA